jgi:hypothetical protein
MMGHHFGTTIATVPIATKEEPKVLLHAGRRHGRKAGRQSLPAIDNF